MPYYLCLGDVLARCAALGSLSIPPQQITLTFDQNFERDPGTSDFYSYLKELKEWDHHGYLGDRVTFANYRCESGIQVADLLARETMKHMENTMLSRRERWARASFIKLRTNPRIHFRFIDRDELIRASVTYPSKLGDDFHEEYDKWRAENGLQGNNLVNRLRFMRVRDSLKTKSAAAGDQKVDSFDN